MDLLQQLKDNLSSVNHTQTSLVNHSVDASCPSSWILDSGATNPICPSKSFFEFLKPIKPIHIKFPNNKIIIANFFGNIHQGKLTLVNVLYVPDFVVHLISIPRLISTISCMVIFCDAHCLIMQKFNFHMIGAAKRWNGLFYLQDSSDLGSCGSTYINLLSFSNFSNVITIDSSML
uniref:Retrovirus-related Pol polyprotein from transposon TNT 1-94-like beta-barrel domain-containing protein n=1 Tax=Cajanus cajan TaxID=3821 RepID=A0A151RG52_CAJCA|nr:hypothetical protein KK1_037229 [Cajanus cajan]